ncbi:serine hydrolase FSH [Bisporella sp. PMI_857]|nr:serine hydrolase FSH [Bisporella sp. PMI_857]
MRVLCLHGRGSSAKIFRSQTASFRKKLKSDFDFDFVDGFFPSTPAADLPLFYPPPYYSFWKNNDLESIRASHHWLKAKIQCNGPYDGVLLFSQGCAVIASFLLYSQQTNPLVPPPFKFAMFVCGGLPLDVVEDLGLEVSREAHEMDLRTKHQLSERTHGITTVKPGSDRWQRFEEAAINPYDIMWLPNVFGLDVTQIPLDMTISIPTVHIFGSKDPRYPASLQLAHFCDPAVRRMYDHGGGHDIPRSKVASESLAELLTWCSKVCVSEPNGFLAT